MLGLFNALDMGARSLAAQQLATEVTGQNLANVNNPGYSRQIVDLQASADVPSSAGPEGTGVSATAIQQVRDFLLDNRIQAEGSVSGSLSAQQQALQYAEAALGEQITNQTSGDGSAGSPDGLSAGLTSLFNAFQSLSASPTSLSQRQVLVQTAQQLTTQFNQVASGLSSIRDGLNSSIQSDVTSANQDLSDIASLNKQIVTAEASGGTANDLRDLRQQKIEDLAGKVNVTTNTESNGTMDITIGGVTMVSGVSQADSLQAFDAGGGQMLVKAQTAGTTLSLTGGSIEGGISVRDGALATLQGNVNTLATQLINQVNTIHAAGFDLNGGTGQNFFTGTDAATIGVNANLVADPSQIQASGVSGATGDNSVALALAQLANNSIAALNNQTFSSNYSQTVAGLGQSLASVNDQSANSTAVAGMLQNQRSSVSGVSLDEEMTNLMSFQKAYQASAQLITTINEMLQTVVAMKTV